MILEDILRRIAGKLVADGITPENYSKDDAVKILSQTVLPTKQTKIFINHEQEILELISLIIKTNNMEQTFFRSLYALLNDKQVVKITTTRVDDKLTLLINNKSKLITMTGTPEEVDDAIIDHLKVNGETTEEKFNVTVSDAPESEEEDDGEKPDKKTKSNPKPKKSAPKPVKPDAKVDKEKAKLKEFTDALDSGNADMKAKDYEKAIEFFKKAKAIAPKGNDVAGQKIEEAKQSIEKAKVAEKKKEFDELMKLGLQQRTDRKYEDSLETIKKAAKLFPDDAEAVKQLASAKKWIDALKGM